MLYCISIIYKGIIRLSLEYVSIVNLRLEYTPFWGFWEVRSLVDLVIFVSRVCLVNQRN